jgi:ABC-2 type transport system permease protein
VKPFANETAKQTYFDASLKSAQTLLADAPDRVTVTKPVVEGTKYSPAAQASTGQLITWVFIPLLGISALYAFERQQGTLRRLLTTPTSRATFLLGTIGGQLAIALFQMALLVVFGTVVMKLNWGQSPVALALMLFCFGLAAAALGTMLGTFVRSEGQASGVSILLGMVMALLGGCWYPIELFPPAVRTVVNVLPTTWAMQGLSNLVVRGQGLEGVWLEASVLLGFAAVFFVVGVWRFKFE